MLQRLDAIVLSLVDRVGEWLQERRGLNIPSIILSGVLFDIAMFALAASAAAFSWWGSIALVLVWAGLCLSEDWRRLKVLYQDAFSPWSDERALLYAEGAAGVRAGRVDRAYRVLLPLLLLALAPLAFLDATGMIRYVSEYPVLFFAIKCAAPVMVMTIGIWVRICARAVEPKTTALSRSGAAAGLAPTSTSSR